jgi:YebC/PmpR family DNA-binding regulatory protein
MAGHNKWSKIKRQKEKTDAEKSKLFGKLVKVISLEAKRSGGDENSPGLRTAINKAREANVPNENIERAIKKAGEAGMLEEALYEFYGPGGAAVLVETLTTNKNRTVQEIKHILGKHGLALSNPGSALWAFEKTAEGWVPKTNLKIDATGEAELFSLLVELEEHDDVQEVYTNVG